MTSFRLVLQPTLTYFGKGICQGQYKSGAKEGQPCEKWAYYQEGDQILCGIHSNKTKRITLPKNPKADQIKEEQRLARMEKVNQVSQLNFAAGKRGQLIVTKFRMMKGLEYVDGYYPVFPNYKHGNRKDGYGCPALSPKSMGPITHIMPKLPPALNLENFHQFAKVFPFELDENGRQKLEYFEARIVAYHDPIPHRHKYDRKELKKKMGQDKNINIPAFSLYYTAQGEERKFNYFGCRYFYCKKYEEIALKTKEFGQLKEWLDKGVNLQIVGYDGYSVNKSLWECYCDVGRPFGHELVLYTLLTVDEMKNYPWNLAYQKWPEMYQGVGI